MTPQAVLAQSLSLPNGVVFKNRLVKSAMSEALGTRQGAPSPALCRLYQAWAEGGIGLCITGNVMIDHTALGEPGNVVIADDRDLPLLKAWAQAASLNNTQCWVQLNHPGKQAPKGLNKGTVSPSAVPFRADMQAFFATPRELTDAEVRALVQRFGEAAKVVKKAGFSGVQIHGAHGYLVSQFLSPHHNIRTDNWGGTPEKRRRFVLVVFAAMRKAVGATPSAILLQFLLEAVTLCLVGGLVGVLIGQAFALAVSSIPGAKMENASVPAWAVALAFVFSAGVGVVFGMFPAIKASRLDPIEALRHE